mgnify:CR=1 FL=1
MPATVLSRLGNKNEGLSAWATNKFSIETDCRRGFAEIALCMKKNLPFLVSFSLARTLLLREKGCRFIVHKSGSEKFLLEVSFLFDQIVLLSNLSVLV